MTRSMLKGTQATTIICILLVAQQVSLTGAQTFETTHCRCEGVDEDLSQYPTDSNGFFVIDDVFVVDDEVTVIPQDNAICVDREQVGSDSDTTNNNGDSNSSVTPQPDSDSQFWWLDSLFLPDVGTLSAAGDSSSDENKPASNTSSNSGGSRKQRMRKLNYSLKRVNKKSPEDAGMGHHPHHGMPRQGRHSSTMKPHEYDQNFATRMDHHYPTTVAARGSTSTSNTISTMACDFNNKEDGCWTKQEQENSTDQSLVDSSDEVSAVSRNRRIQRANRFMRTSSSMWRWSRSRGWYKTTSMMMMMMYNGGGMRMSWRRWPRWWNGRSPSSPNPPTSPVDSPSDPLPDEDVANDSGGWFLCPVSGDDSPSDSASSAPMTSPAAAPTANPTGGPSSPPTVPPTSRPTVTPTASPTTTEPFSLDEFQVHVTGGSDPGADAMLATMTAFLEQELEQELFGLSSGAADDVEVDLTVKKLDVVPGQLRRLDEERHLQKIVVVYIFVGVVTFPRNVENIPSSAADVLDVQVLILGDIDAIQQAFDANPNITVSVVLVQVDIIPRLSESPSGSPVEDEPAKTSPTGLPTEARTGSPSSRVDEPEAANPTGLPTTAPMISPTPEPSVALSQNGSPTPAPTYVETYEREEHRVTITGVTMSLQQVGLLDGTAIQAWKDTTEAAYERYYSDQSVRQKFSEIVSFETTLIFRTDNPNPTGTENMILYDQAIVVTAYSVGREDEFSVEELITAAFQDAGFISDYTQALRQSDSAFSNVEGSINVLITGQTSPPTQAPTIQETFAPSRVVLEMAGAGLTMSLPMVGPVSSSQSAIDAWTTATEQAYESYYNGKAGQALDILLFETVIKFRSDNPVGADNTISFDQSISLTWILTGEHSDLATQEKKLVEQPFQDADFRLVFADALRQSDDVFLDVVGSGVSVFYDSSLVGPPSTAPPLPSSYSSHNGLPAGTLAIDEFSIGVTGTSSEDEVRDAVEGYLSDMLKADYSWHVDFFGLELDIDPNEAGVNADGVLVVAFTGRVAFEFDDGCALGDEVKAKLAAALAVREVVDDAIGPSFSEFVAVETVKVFAGTGDSCFS